MESKIIKVGSSIDKFNYFFFQPYKSAFSYLSVRV